jgi:diacylglycerol kinase (ATP)
MKYIFVINPAAGIENSEDRLLDSLKKKKKLNYDIYYTKAPKDAISFVKKTCQENPQETFCFVAAGGDGTLNEVVNGVADCENACFGCWPCGSGNDFVKYYGEVSNAANLDNLLNGHLETIDLLLINGKRYSVNVIDTGFDCVVINQMEKIRRTPIIGGKNAYTTGIVQALFGGRHHRGIIKVDGQIINPKGTFMLATFANASHIGGGYKAAPRALADDGLIDVCVARPISIPKLAQIIGIYRKGEHLEDKRCKGIFSYYQGRVVEIDAASPLYIAADGEMIKSRHFRIEIVDKKVRYLVPRNSIEHKKGSEN